MKNLPFKMFLIGLISTFLTSCLKDDIEDLQKQIDDLKSNANDTIHFGDLIILNQEQLKLLENRNIKHITGELRLENIEELSPLKDLKSVGSFYLYTDSDLKGFYRLYDLKVYEYFYMSFNSNNDLIIDGFENIETLEGFMINNNGYGNFTISGMNSIKSCYYLDFYTNGLITVNGFEDLESGYLSFGCNRLIINSFKEIRNFEGSINIRTDFLTINGFENIEEILGDLYIGIFNNDALNWESGNEFIRLKRVGGRFSTPVYKNFTNLEFIHTLEISSYFSEENLSKVDLPSLSELYELSVLWNNNIKTFDGLNIPQFYSLYIYDCDSLNDISILSELMTSDEIPSNNQNDYFYSQIAISDNFNLTNLNGLENVNKISNLEISYNRNLVDFCGIRQLIDSVEDYTWIGGNAFNPQNSSEIIGCE